MPQHTNKPHTRFYAFDIFDAVGVVAARRPCAGARGRNDDLTKVELNGESPNRSHKNVYVLNNKWFTCFVGFETMYALHMNIFM